MKSKNLFAILIVCAFFSACNALPATQTATSTLPTPEPVERLDRSTLTPMPTLVRLTRTQNPSPTITPRLTATPTPYSTAGAVNPNAIAFISPEHNKSFDLSLWVANIDGSGERKLIDVKDNSEWTRDIQIGWSPNGKWISYLSSDELWIISPDGSVKRKLLDAPKEGASILGYKWSPDSSKIAYQNTFPAAGLTKTPTPGPWRGLDPYLVGIVDITTGKVSELSSHEANAGVPFLLWSPNGRYLLFVKDFSFALFEVATRKIVQEIKRGCGLERNISWSPNGEWLSYTDNGVGRYFSQWICVHGLHNPVYQIKLDGTASVPVWDKTGKFLYFVARKTNPDSIPNLQLDERLMKYDVRTQKAERLLSLRDQQTYSYIQSVSISPDGRTLLLQSQTSKTTFDLTFVDPQSLATTKFTLDFTTLKIPLKDAYDSYFLETGWSPNSQDIILSAGTICTPERTCVQHYGAFYRMNVKTGKINIFSGDHPVNAWKIAPIKTNP